MKLRQRTSSELKLTCSWLQRYQTACSGYNMVRERLDIDPDNVKLFHDEQSLGNLKSTLFNSLCTRLGYLRDCIRDDDFDDPMLVVEVNEIVTSVPS